MANYVQFTQGQFEFNLRGILIKNRCGFMEEITQQWLNEGNETWEKIYKISTKNKSVDVIVFSSIDIKTSKVRGIGSDTVKIVMRWNTKHGYVYKKMAHHYRLETLFNNIEKTVLKAQNEVFALNFKEFAKAI